MKREVLQMNKILTAVLPVFIALAVFLMSSTASAQGVEQQRADALQAASEALAYIDRWVEEYEKQLREADPTEKAKYEEWLRELSKLRELVEEAVEKIKNCETEECIEDQANLIGIAQQQVDQLIKEAEERLGETVRFGEEAGREVSQDDALLGDDTMDTAGWTATASPMVISWCGRCAKSGGERTNGSARRRGRP